MPCLWCFRDPLLWESIFFCALFCDSPIYIFVTLCCTAVTQNARLALHVWARTRDAQEVLPAQDGFVWNHGTYQFHTLTTDHGDVPPLEGWARMWTHPSENEVRGRSRYRTPVLYCTVAWVEPFLYLGKATDERQGWARMWTQPSENEVRGRSSRCRTPVLYCTVAWVKPFWYPGKATDERQHPTK